MAGSASRLGPDEDPCMCSMFFSSSGISFQDSVFSNCPGLSGPLL